MNRALQILIGLSGLLFLVMGLRWAVDPSGAATGLGMPLMTGLAQSSQVGDVGGLFLSLGLMILFALVSGRAIWFQAAALLLLNIAIFRLLAWSLHGAALAAQMIGVEIVIALLLTGGARRLSEDA